MLFEENGVGRPVFLKEAGRPFDVGEEERDRARWKRSCAHRAIISYGNWRCDYENGPVSEAFSGGKT
jgi:hypothetical protein